MKHTDRGVKNRNIAVQKQANLSAAGANGLIADRPITAALSLVHAVGRNCKEGVWTKLLDRDAISFYL